MENKRDMTYETFLVTGAAGFIGSNYIELSLEKHPDRRVVALDALTYASTYDVIKPYVDEKLISFVKCDIRNPGQLEKVFDESRPDVIVNYAAESHVDSSIQNTSLFYETNVMGCINLLECARKYKTRRFLQVSTDEVYGSLSLDDDRRFTESDRLSPSSPYSASKAGAEMAVLAYHRTYDLDVVITRSSNNFGPHQHYEKLIPKVIRNAFFDKKIPVYGTGENIRDWIFVKDNALAIDEVIEKGKSGEVYNVGGGNEKSNLWIIRKILRIMGKSDELIEFVEDRPGHDERYALSDMKTRSEIGFSPTGNFEERLHETIRYYVKKLEKALR